MSMETAVQVMRLNSYYPRTFGWELAEVDALFASQGNVCRICGRPPGAYRLSLDHDHAVDKIPILVVRNYQPPLQMRWFANAQYKGCIFYGFGVTKFEARKLVKIQLRRASVRGGLCLRCNKGIQMFEDSKAPLSPQQRFENAVVYFREFNQKLGTPNEKIDCPFDNPSDALVSTRKCCETEEQKT